MSSLLRTRLLHIAHGCSLRTPSVGAKAAGWGSMADVAWLKKLRACEGWLCALGAGLLKESGLGACGCVWWPTPSSRSPALPAVKGACATV